MNNVLILGKATLDQYVKAITCYCDPEDLNIYVFQEDVCNALEDALAELHLQLNIESNDDDAVIPNTTIAFTNYVNISEVNACTEAVAAGIPFILINPEKY